MNKAQTWRPLTWFGIPLLLLGLICLIAKSTAFGNSAALSFGVTFDLLLTIPIVYLLLIRKTDIPKITVVPLFLVGVAVATILLPAENQQFLRWVKTWILPMVEIIVLFIIMGNARRVVKHLKSREHEPDFFTTLKHACAQVFPNIVVSILATEIAVFYYGFIHWKTRTRKANEFTYHKNSGIISLLIAFMCILAIETWVIHLLLLRWSSTAAWIMTALSLYTSIQLLGFLKSIINRPISIVGNKLFLRYGILSEADMEIGNIDLMEWTTKSIEPHEAIRKLSPFGDIEGHNVIIRLRREGTVYRLYGMRRKFNAIALWVDNPDEFKRQVEAIK